MNATTVRVWDLVVRFGHWWLAVLFLVVFYGLLVGTKLVLAVLTARWGRSLTAVGYRHVCRVLGLALLVAWALANSFLFAGANAAPSDAVGASGTTSAGGTSIAIDPDARCASPARCARIAAWPWSRTSW